MTSSIRKRPAMFLLRQRAYKRKTVRMWIILSCLICFSGAAALMLRAFSSDIVFFMTPSQIIEAPPRADQSIRLGGMVVAGSLRQDFGLDHQPVNHFDVTDGRKAITVEFAGVLPDLFREGQSVVTIGTLTPNASFKASEVLAKHDETYMPKEVADALRKSGKWDPRFGKPPQAQEWDMMTRAQAQKSLRQASDAH